MSFRGHDGLRMIRTVSVALAFALFLQLTPCCEVLAAVTTSGVPVTTDTLHTHSESTLHQHDDGDAPFSGERCAPWLDQIYIPAGEAALLASEPPDIHALLLSSQPFKQFLLTVDLVPHAGAPPPTRALYLLTSRFLL